MEDLSSRDGKDYSTPEENPQEKRKSKAVPIILAVAGILLLAGLGTYLVVNRSPKNTGADAKKQSMPLEQRESTRALASQYMENGEYDQAISLLKAYIDENPTDAEALTLLQIAQSEKESLNAPESTDDILQTYNNFISTGDYATALRLIAATPEETLVSQGIDGPALISKARALENGRNLMNQGAYEQAASDLGIYLSQNPGDADAEKLLNQVNRLSTLASNSNIAGIDNSAGRTDLSASDDSSSNANGNSGATSAYAGTTGDLVSLNSSSASGNAGPSSSSYEQTPVVSSFTGMNSLPEGTTSRTENQSSAGNTSSRTGNTQPVANVNPRTNGSSSSPSTEGTASGTSANAATPVRNAGTSSSTPAANTGSAPVTRTVSTISTPGANSTSSSPRTEGSASGTSANAATPVRNAGTSSSTPAANTSSAPVTRTVSTIPSSQVPANTSGSQGRLSELLAQATASASDDNSIVSDGTRTSPEVLLRRYGRRAITRNEALAVGRDYINDRKYDEAINLMRELLTLNPNDEEARRLLEEAQDLKRRNGGNGGARTADQNLALARRWINQGNYDDAITLLNSILNKDPSNEEAGRLLKEALAARNGETPEAKRAREQAEQAAENERKAREEAERNAAINEARNALRNGNPEDAIAALERILAENPNDAQAKALLEQAENAKAQADRERQNNLNEAKSGIANGDYDDAINALNQILKNNPNDEEAKKLLAQATAAKRQEEKDRQDKLNQAKNLMNAGRYDEASAILNDLLKQNPNDAEVQKLLANIGAKKVEAARDRQNKLNAAEDSINSGNYDQAINALNQILRNNPNDAEARKLLEEANAKKEQARKDAAEKDRQNKLAQAKNNINSGNYDQAINTLNQILRSNPNDAEARKLLEEANAKKEQARKDAAEKDRQNKLAQARNSIDAGKYDQAISTLNGLLRTNPNDTEAGKLLEEAKAKKEAGDKAAAAAKERQNKLAQARNLINKEDYDGAMAIAQDLLKNNPNDTDARQLLEEAGRKKTQSAANKARQEKINRASALINSRNYDEAIALLNDVLKEDPNNTQAKNLLSQAQNKKAAAEKDRQNKLSQAKKYIDAGEYDKAQALLNGLIADNNGRDSDAQNLMNQASAKKAAAEQAAKEEEAKADAAKKKQQAEEAIAKGKAALQRGNSDEALSQFDQAKSLLPESERSYAGEKLGEMAQALYDGAQLPVNASSKSVLENAAAQYANAALAKDSNNAPSHYVLGMQAYGSKNYPKAEQELNQAAILDSKNGVYWYQLGRAQAMQRKYTQAAASFQNSINCDGTFAPAYYNLGYVQERNGNTTAALSSYKEACRVDAKYERAYIAAGRLMANAGDYKGAVDAFASAIKVNPSNAQTYQEQGSAYANLKDYKSAENSFRKALAYMDQSKPDAATYYNLSSVLSEQGKNAEGVTYAKMAYDNKASANKALQVNIIYNYGLLSERTGKKSQAVSLYEEALSLDSSHMKSKINLGALYLEQGDVESALTFLNSAYNQDKNNFEANNNLGNAYREKGDYAMAVTYYQNALKLVPTDNTVRENLAKVYASAGQYSNAKAAYEDVVAADERNWVAQLELAKIDMSLGNNAEAIERLEFLQLNNPSFMRTEVSSLLYSLR